MYMFTPNFIKIYPVVTEVELSTVDSTRHMQSDSISHLEQVFFYQSIYLNCYLKQPRLDVTLINILNFRISLFPAHSNLAVLVAEILSYLSYFRFFLSLLIFPRVLVYSLLFILANQRVPRCGFTCEWDIAIPIFTQWSNCMYRIISNSAWKG